MKEQTPEEKYEGQIPLTKEEFDTIDNIYAEITCKEIGGNSNGTRMQIVCRTAKKYAQSLSASKDKEIEELKKESQERYDGWGQSLKLHKEREAKFESQLQSKEEEISKIKSDSQHYKDLWKQGCDIIDVIEEQLQSKEEMLGKAVEAINKIKDMIWSDEYDVDEEALNAIKMEAVTFLSSFNQENNNQNSGK